MSEELDKLLEEYLQRKEERKKRFKEIAIVGILIIFIWDRLRKGFNGSRKLFKTLPWYYIGVPNFWKKIGVPYPSKVPTWVDGLIILLWVFCLTMMDFNESGELNEPSSFVSILFVLFTLSISYFMFSFFTKAIYENKKINKYFISFEETIYNNLSNKLQNQGSLSPKEDKILKDLHAKFNN